MACVESGNQRDRAREKAQKKAQGQKGKTTASGTQMQRDKEAAAEIMRQKQAKALEKKATEAAATGSKK
ncbi:hypothetical protein EV426DRAFT_707700 [Tirmania nivea]|nr:hypothetical protein EV426DRAFT_707700 [Tirmania nivea]